MSKSITAKKFRPISIKRLQIEFNAMIARGQPCAKCGQTFPVMQCSHVHSTGSYPNLRFDVMNVLPMCGHHHNFWWHLEPSESWDWFKKEYPGRYEYLLKAKNKYVGRRGQPARREIRQWIKEKNMKKLIIAPELLDKQPE